MKKIILYGNCQLTTGIYSYLKSLNNFSINIIQSYTFIRNQLKIDYDLLSCCDIFIYQPIHERYGKYASDNIIKFLSPECIKIGIPFLYLDAFFPLIKKNSAHGIDGGEIINENSILNQDIILKLLQKYNKEEIIKMYDNDEIDFNFTERFNENINRMLEKEKLCDIKIVDFILEQYKKIKLFDVHVHPTIIIFDEIMKQIVDILKLNIDIIYNKNWNGKLSNEIYPYSRYSIKHFNFEWIDKEELNSDKYYKNLIINIIDNYIINT
jgi:hypothetical protein